MKGVDGRKATVVGRARRAWLAVVTAMMLAFSLMATAAPAGAGGEQDKDIPGQCDPGYTKIVDNYTGGLSWTADADYSAVVLVGGPKDPERNKDPQGRNATFADVEAGDTISRTAHDISHICAIPDEPELNSASMTVVKKVRSTETDVPLVRFPFAMAADGETELFGLDDGGSRTFDFEFDSDRFDVVVGELTGELAEGFSFVSASCSIGDRVIEQGSRASVSLLDGAEVTCTFVNRYDSESEDVPSVTVIKDVRGVEGAKTTEFDIVVGTRARYATIELEDGESHEFLPLAGTEDFGIAEQMIEEDGWTTAISCVSDMREGTFGARGASFVIDEIGEGEDITCTVINTYDDGDDGPSSPRPTTATTQPTLVTPCFDGTAENELGECVAPEPPEAEIEVLGVQIEATTTTVEAVTMDTLPFTGDSSNRFVIVGLLSLIAGALMLGGSVVELSWIRGGRHESSSRSIQRWVNN